MSFRLELTTAPATEPVTTAEVKTLLKIDDATEDTLVDGLIVAARETVEQILRRALITQSWTMYLPRFPSADCIKLPFPKLISVTSVKYYDTDNSLQTWASTNYQVQTKGTPGEIELAQGISWPSVYDRINAVEILFVAGYGAAAAVPGTIKLAIKHLVAHWLAHREPYVAGVSVAEVPMTLQRILMPYRFLEVK